MDSLDLFLLSLHFTEDPDANRKALRAKKAGIAKKIDDDEDDDDSDVNEEDPFAGGDSSDDPDFLDDMFSDDDDDDDEESGKDSGHDSIATENEDNWSVRKQWTLSIFLIRKKS